MRFILISSLSELVTDAIALATRSLTISPSFSPYHQKLGGRTRRGRILAGDQQAIGDRVNAPVLPYWSMTTRVETRYRNLPA
jgi:hypothetical protein